MPVTETTYRRVALEDTDDQWEPACERLWSPSTGDYDVEEKLTEYRRRGDLEIWRLHPYECTLIAWRLQADGSYIETLYRSGIVVPASLPNVSIELDTLFDLPV